MESDREVGEQGRALHDTESYNASESEETSSSAEASLDDAPYKHTRAAQKVRRNRRVKTSKGKGRDRTSLGQESG